KARGVVRVGRARPSQSRSSWWPKPEPRGPTISMFGSDSASSRSLSCALAACCQASAISRGVAMCAPLVRVVLMRLLVVDDAPDIATLLKLAFQIGGYAVDTALSGEDALELVAVHTKPFDADDLQMTVLLLLSYPAP